MRAGLYRDLRFERARSTGGPHPSLRASLTEIAERFVKAGEAYENRPVALHLRASASTGFRAPSLSQGNWSAISTNFVINQAV